jgi:hypothetical protein
MEGYDFSSTVVQSAIDIITPVMEEAMVLSGEYAKACGRKTILAKDLEYCMKYCAMNSVGKKIGTYFPEIYETDSEESDLEIVDDEEDQFHPYSGDNIQMKEINQAYEAWEAWKPTNPSEEMIKNAIDSNEHINP